MPQCSRRTFIGIAGAASLAAAMPPAAPRPWKPSRLSESVPLDAIQTPALLVDVEQMNTNLDRMTAFLNERGVGLRPHAKTHKCPHIAHQQIERGALGVCCAKVSEAECMAEAGITDILITSPVATKDKIDRVIALAKTCPGLQMVIDHPQNADAFDAAAKAASITLRVLVDLESGTRRTGIAMGDPAVNLAKRIAKHQHLQLDGIQCYAGHLMHIGDFDQRRARSIDTLQQAADTKKRIEDADIPLAVFTGGGTGTYDIDCQVEGITDLQCGSYLFMDVQYGVVGAPGGDLFDAFPPALFVWATAISQPVPDRITLDAGLKALYNDSPRPRLRDHPNTAYGYGGDEHGIVRFDGGGQPIRLGDKVAIVPAHCDPTINLYDAYFAYREGKVEEIWPITARGRGQ